MKNNVLTLLFPIDLERIYLFNNSNDISELIYDNISTFLSIDKSNINVLLKDTILKLYKKFTVFEDKTESIILCNNYIGHYNLDLDITLIDDFNNKHNLAIIKQLLKEEFNANSQKFPKFYDGYYKDIIIGRVYYASEDRIMLLLDEPINNKYKVLIKNKGILNDINKLIIKNNKNIIKITNPILKDYDNIRLILGNCNGYSLLE